MVATMEQALPLTVGDIYGSRTETDETGIKRVNKGKVVQGAQQTQSGFKLSMPQLSGKSFTDWLQAYNDVAATGTTNQWSSEDIASVNSGGIIGNIANRLIQNKYGQA